MQNFNTFRLPFTTTQQTNQVVRDSGKLNKITLPPISSIPTSTTTPKPTARPKVPSTLSTLQHCAWVAKLNGGWYWCDHYNQLGYGLVFNARGERFTTRRECELNALANGFTHSISYKWDGEREDSFGTRRKIKA